MKKIFAGIFFLIFGVFAAVSPIAHASTSSTTPFNTNLSFGMTGNAGVKALQQFLAMQDVYSGPISGNFFTLTMQGVKQFQIMNNIQPSSGYFGPLTRAKAAAIALSENSSIAKASTTITSAPITSVAFAPSPSLLAYMQMQLNDMFAIVRNLGQRFLGKTKTTDSVASIQPVIITAPTTSGSGSGSGSSNVPPPTPNVPVLATIPATPATILAPSAPIPATMTLTVNVSVVGGSAQAKNFNITVTDNAVSSIIFSGAASSVSQQFTLMQGHSYTATEMTTAKSTNYTASSSAGCAGIITASAPICTITNTYSPPASSGASSVSASSSTSGILWGAYVGDIDGTPSLVSSFAALSGKSPDIIATFADLSSGDFPSGEKATVGAQGKTLLLFLEPQYSFDEINSGKYDSIFQQYATAAATYGDPIILAPFDEFNLNENPWGYGVDGNTPAKFIQAWQHIHGFFANDPNVKFALVYNNVPEPADSINTYAAYYPGNAYVDYVTVDGFNFGTTSASAQSFAQIFNPIMPTLESFDKPILFTSIGSLEYPGKAQWISQGLGTYIEQYPNVAGWVYFDYNDTSAGQNWRVDTDPAALAAFQAAIP